MTFIVSMEPFTPNQTNKQDTEAATCGRGYKERNVPNSQTKRKLPIATRFQITFVSFVVCIAMYGILLINSTQTYP